MNALQDYMKGVVVGLGGIAPGLSGSVLLIILGLYEKTVNAIGTLFQNFKKNVLFLLPLVLGIGTGAVLFGKLINALLASAEFQTRYLFLGLILGTIPLFWGEVRKNGFSVKYYFVIAAAAAAGLFLFVFNQNLFPQISNPNLAQSVLLGVAYAGSAIVPGVDSATILSALGMYQTWLDAISAPFESLSVLIPAAAGLAVGALLISAVMNFLIKRFYTVTFSVIFGLFLTIIPSVLNLSESDVCVPDSAGEFALAAVFVLIGFVVSLYFSDIPGWNQKLRVRFGGSPRKR